MKQEQLRQRSIAEENGSGGNRGENWMSRETMTGRFGDERLERRFRAVLKKLAKGIGKSIPWACQDWANTKAAYRFFSNARVSEHKILSGHRQATRERVPSGSEPILVVHDTTEFIFHPEDATAIGVVSKGASRKEAQGRPVLFTTCGICLHSSLVVTTAGVPLGLAAAKFWRREEFKGCHAPQNKAKSYRRPIEEKESRRWLDNLQESTRLLGQPQRCVHMGDREGDIYELFCAAQQADTHFLIRTRADRLVEGGPDTMEQAIEQTPRRGTYRISVRDKKGRVSLVVLEIRYQQFRIFPPRGRKRRFPALVITVIEARERDTPRGRERIDWKLVTDLPVRSRAEVIEKVQWYTLRWRIETFHKVLKSGCHAEQAKLRTAARLINLLALLCILSWRIFWLTMINRSAPEARPDLVFTTLELRVLDAVIKNPPKTARQPRTISRYLTKLARLGGYLARASDPPPGNTVIWRGLTSLIDIEFGVMIGAQLVGN
jgi:hypothetical protein